MEVCSARTPQMACTPPQSINININTASHLKVALDWSRIQNIIRDHDTFLMRSTAEWMHCHAVVICKIQSSYSTKSYFQRDGRLAGPNGCCLKPLGKWGFFFTLSWERRAHILCSIKVLIHSHTTAALLSCLRRSSPQITIITVFTVSLHSTHPHNTDHRSFWYSCKSLYSHSFFSFMVFVTFRCVLCVVVSHIFNSSEDTEELGP